MENAGRENLVSLSGRTMGVVAYGLPGSAIVECCAPTGMRVIWCILPEFGLDMMADTKPQRRLAAVLAADVVGYSRLIEADEAGTLAAMRQLWSETFNPAVAANRGRVVKMMGDGALVEFGSAVDAVECAISIQRSLAQRARPGSGSDPEYPPAAVS